MQIGSLPANCIVVKNAPQVELLKRSALCITHAGLNTALESLTQGVPMVAIPVSIDQPGVAARIAYTKTGRYVPLQEMTAPRLSALIDDQSGVSPECRQDETGDRRNKGTRKGSGSAGTGVQPASNEWARAAANYTVTTAKC